MSRDSSVSEGLTDWALVSREGSIEVDDASNGSSSDDFVNVTQDGVAFGRHRSSSVETSLQPEICGASTEASNLLQSSLDDLDEDEAPEDSRFPTVPGFSSLPSSMASTGDGSIGVLPDDEDKSQDLLPAVLTPCSIDLLSSLSSRSPALESAEIDAGATTDCTEASSSDDVVFSISTDSIGSSNGEKLVSRPKLLAGCLKFPYEEERSGSNDIVPGREAEEEDARGGGGVGGAFKEEIEWLKLPIESSSGQMNAIRLGNGRVIVAPPGADLGTLVASFKSETSSDTDSDFVRLDGISTCSSSNDNSDTEVDELSREELATGADAQEEDVMTASVSSVSSRFRFLPHKNGQADHGDTADEGSPPGLDDVPLAVPLPLPNASPPAAAPATAPAAAPPTPPATPPVAPHLDAAPALAPLVPPVPAFPGVLRPVVNGNADGDDYVEDADTESVSGRSDEDERIESDQSENISEQLNEDEDHAAFNDIANIPLVAGHPQYRHSPNGNFNWTLDVVVVMVILVVVGLGIGHSIGSIREHYLQYEQQQAQEWKTTLLGYELLDCKQKTDAILKRHESMKQTELDQRREALADLILTNRDLRGQMDALQSEMTTQLSALSQCREVGKDLRQVSAGIRKEMQHLRDVNSDLASRGVSTKDNTDVPSLKDRTEEVSASITNLKKQIVILKNENKGLKTVLNQLTSEDDAAEVVQDERSDDPPTSCPRQDGGRGPWTDLKARINSLEQENSDLRTEIGRLRYKYHPGNHHHTITVTEDDHQEVTVDEDEFSGIVGDDNADTEDEVVLHGVKSQNETSSLEKLSAEVERLKVELNSTHKQILTWKQLYLNLKDREPESVRCNKTTNMLTCMRVLAHRLNISINMTSLKDFVNFTKFLMPLEEVREVFLSEFRALWKQFSSYDNGPQENETEDEGKPRNAQKVWSDNLKDILNKTQSSMTTMSQQIKATWSQVKNLSNELWKKHEPSLSKVATKISRKVQTFSSHVSKTFQQKASRWFRKIDKHQKHGKHGCKKWQGSGGTSETQKNVRDEKKRHATRKWQKSDGRNKKERRKRDTDEGKNKKSGQKSYKNNGNTIDVYKEFRFIKKRMDKMSEHRHSRMTEMEVKAVCNLLIGFQTNWDIYKWLYAADVKWTICQSAWWHDRLRDRVPSLLSECTGNIYGWQYEWAPSVGGKGNFFKPKQVKQHRQEKKLKNIIERNNAKGKPYSYEEEKAVVNGTLWARFRDDVTDDSDSDRDHGGADWYGARMEDRLNQRNVEHKSDWMFDRAANRGKERMEDGYVSVAQSDSSGMVDPRAEWMFVRAEERDYLHTQPDSWYYKRADMRQKGTDDDYAVHNHHEDRNDHDDDDYGEGDYDGDYYRHIDL